MIISSDLLTQPDRELARPRPDLSFLRHSFTAMAVESLGFFPFWE